MVVTESGPTNSDLGTVEAANKIAQPQFIDPQKLACKPMESCAQIAIARLTIFFIDRFLGKERSRHGDNITQTCFKTATVPLDQYDLSALNKFSATVDSREKCADLCFNVTDCHFALWHPRTGDCGWSSRYRVPNCASNTQDVKSSDPVILFCIACRSVRL